MGHHFFLPRRTAQLRVKRSFRHFAWTPDVCVNGQPLGTTFFSSRVPELQYRVPTLAPLPPHTLKKTTSKSPLFFRVSRSISVEIGFSSQLLVCQIFLVAVL